MDFPKFQDLFDIGANQILTLNGAVTVDAVTREGTDINIDVAASAAIGDECVGQLVRVAAGTFLDSAKGVVLDRLLFDRYGLLRKPAAPALGSVEFTVVGSNGHAVANPAAFAIPVDTVVQTISGEQFVTTASEVYPLASLGPVTVAVRSVLAGADQQAAEDTITSIISNIPGGPASPNSLTVNNPLATAGADDEEQDDDFRARGRAFFSTARRGTLDAIIQGALAVAGVRTAEAFEVIDLQGFPARSVELVVADAYTDSLAKLTTVVPTYQTQSQVLALAVFNALDSIRAAGIYVRPFVGQVVMQPIQLNLAFAAGVNVDLVALQARAAGVAYTNNLIPGQKWVRADAQAYVALVPGLIITGNEIASPTGDVVPTPLQVVRTSMAICSAVALGLGVQLQATVNPDAATS